MEPKQGLCVKAVGRDNTLEKHTISTYILVITLIISFPNFIV